MIFFVSFVSIQNLYFENGFSKLDRVLRISQTENMELISESEFSTRWDFINGTAGYIYHYNETFDIGYDNWYLEGVSSETFEKNVEESGNYLLDKYTLSDNIEYTGIHFDISSENPQPYGICWDGTYLWVVGIYTQKVYKYNAAGVYQSVSFDVTSEDTFPFGICWDGEYFWMVGCNNKRVYKYNAAGVYQSVSFDVSSEDTFPFGICWDGTHFWVLGGNNVRVYKYNAAGVYQSVSFDISSEDIYPYGIEWDGTHFWVVGSDTQKVYKYNAAGVYQSVNFDISSEDSLPIGICWDGTYFWVVGIDTIEVYKYDSDVFIISKIYNGDGYIYIQTNETETLKVRSSDTLNLNLTIGDKIEITFNTSSTNGINFNLRNNSIQQKSFILSGQGNGNFNDQIKTFTITSNVPIDQFEFTGTFDDTKNLIVKNINISRPYSETLRYYLAPYGYRQLDLGYSHNYTVEVYENDEMMESWSITTSETLQTLVYERIDYDVSYITFYDSNNEYLQFANFITYANYTLNNFTYIDNRLSNNIIYTDKDSVINFNIYDSFEVLVKTFETYEETFIDIILDVYSLKIKNEAQKFIEYKLSKIGSSVVKSGNIFPEEIVGFNVASGDYSLDYVNYEDMYSRQFNFTLSDHEIITINSTYHQVYFSLFTYDGFGVNHDFVRFYINNARKDFGFNTLKQDTNTLKILDYFNATLFNSNINLKQFTEYNIYIEIYTMIIFNNYSHSIKIAIERNDIEFEQIIEAQFSMPYRMLPNVEYIVSIYYLNGTLLEEREVELDENNKIVPFGFYSEEVPYYPSFDNTSITIVLIILIFIGIISLPTYFAYKYNKRVQRLKFAYTLQHTIDKDLIEVASGRSSRMNKIK